MEFIPHCSVCLQDISNNEGRVLSCSCFVCNSCFSSHHVDSYGNPFRGCPACLKQKVNMIALGPSLPKDVSTPMTDILKQIRVLQDTISFQTTHYKRILKLAAKGKSIDKQHIENLNNKVIGQDNELNTLRYFIKSNHVVSSSSSSSSSPPIELEPSSHESFFGSHDDQDQHQNQSQPQNQNQNQVQCQSDHQLTGHDHQVQLYSRYNIQATGTGTEQNGKGWENESQSSYGPQQQSNGSSDHLWNPPRTSVRAHTPLSVPPPSRGTKRPLSAPGGVLPGQEHQQQYQQILSMISMNSPNANDRSVKPRTPSSSHRGNETYPFRVSSPSHHRLSSPGPKSITPSSQYSRGNVAAIHPSRNERHQQQHLSRPTSAASMTSVHSISSSRSELNDIQRQEFLASERQRFKGHAQVSRQMF
jgi:hypothetical protein